MNVCTSIPCMFVANQSSNLVLVEERAQLRHCTCSYWRASWACDIINCILSSGATYWRHIHLHENILKEINLKPFARESHSEKLMMFILYWSVEILQPALLRRTAWQITSELQRLVMNVFQMKTVGAIRRKLHQENNPFYHGFHPQGDHWAKIVEQCAIKNRVQYIHCR
jgi:hypothetical protein